MLTRPQIETSSPQLDRRRVLKTAVATLPSFWTLKAPAIAFGRSQSAFAPDATEVSAAVLSESQLAAEVTASLIQTERHAIASTKRCPNSRLGLSAAQRPPYVTILELETGIFSCIGIFDFQRGGRPAAGDRGRGRPDPMRHESAAVDCFTAVRTRLPAGGCQLLGQALSKDRLSWCLIVKLNKRETKGETPGAVALSIRSIASQDVDVWRQCLYVDKDSGHMFVKQFLV